MDCYHNSQKKASLFDLYQLVVCEHSGFVFVHNKKIMISYSTSGAELTKRAFAQTRARNRQINEMLFVNNIMVIPRQ